MTVLLDTNVFYWALTDRAKLSDRASFVLLSDEPKLLSPLTPYELAQKVARGKLELPLEPSEFCRRGVESLVLEWLGIEFRHISISDSLPWYHRDPFDRILAMQAIVEGVAIVSSDAMFESYGIRRIW